MKKIFGFKSGKGAWRWGSPTSPQTDAGVPTVTSSSPGYCLRDKDLGKIHKAASAGNVATVQQILLLGKNGLNDRDKMSRTALHLACANGHQEVVTLLVERKCQLNLCDGENRTPLMKAVQCQQEACVAILLDHGADPDLVDVYGNTALHYAVGGQSAAIVAKLLAHNADVEVRNKDDLTPLLLALSENKQQMVELLGRKEANIHAVDKIKSNHQLISQYKEEKTLNSSPAISNHEVQEPARQISRKRESRKEDESSEEYSLSRLSSKPGIDDSWPTSDDEDLDFETKTVPKLNFAKLMTASQQCRKSIEAKCGTMRPESRSLSEDNNSDSENEDIVETLPKPPIKAQEFSHPVFPSTEPLTSLAVLDHTKEEATKTAVGHEEKDNDINGSAPQEHTNNYNLAFVDGAHKNNRSDMMSALGLGEEEDIESPWDSESISESLPQKYVDHLSGAADQRGKNTLNGQVDESPEKYPHLKPTIEVKNAVPKKVVGVKDVQTFQSDLSAELDLEMTSEEDQERLDGSENEHPLVEEENEMHKNSEIQSSENICVAADRGLTQHIKNRKTNDQHFPVVKNEDSDSSGPALPMKEVKKNENEKWTVKEPVTASMFAKAGSLTGGVFQVNDDSSLSEVDQNDERLIKKTSKEKNKVKKQINSVDNFEDLTQSSETASEDCDLPYSNYKNCMLLIEQLSMDCKDSVSLLKIQDTVLSYERLIELKKNHCQLLSGKIKKMRNKISELQKELSETKEIKSQLEHQTVEWKQELSSLRFTLKQEEVKRRNSDTLCEKIREQLKRKEEQYHKEVEVKQQLELNLRTQDMELRTLRNNLNQVVEERNDTQRQLSREQNARISQDGILNNLLCKQKEIEMAHKKTNSEVSDIYEKEKDLVHKNHMLQDEIAMLKLAIDTIRSQNQEKENKYFEDIEIIKEKNDDLLKTIKLNEETLTKTISQYSGQLNALKTENSVLSSKLENEKQNKDRLETEIESFHSRLASAIHDHDESQTSKRDLELTFQRAKDEWLRLQDKMNFDVSNLKDNNEILSQELSKAESKLNNLEIELHHTRDALREKTLVLERAQRDLHQTQSQKKEIEQMYQNEQGKVNKYIGKQESLEERLSQLQSENMLLLQQLDDAHHKNDIKEKLVMNIQDQFQDVVKRLQAESEKQGLMLEERNKELITECNHLKERMYQYENEKAAREVDVRQLQQELADTLKKQAMAEASLEVTAHHRVNLEEEIQDLKKKLSQIRSQLQEAQDGHTEAVRCAEKMQDQLQKLETENAKLKGTVKKQACKIEQLQETLLNTNPPEDEKEELRKYMELKQSLEYNLDQEMKKNSELEKEIIGFKKLLKMSRRKLNDYESGELSFHGDLTANPTEMDSQINILKKKIDDLTAKLETASSNYLHVDAKNQVLQQELSTMKAMQKKCEKLERNKKKLEQELVNLKSHMEMNMVEHYQVEQYKREIEERARQDVVEKLKEVNLFIQAQAASHENLEQLRENHNASIRNQMDLRIKDLESELSKMKISQEDSSKIELEKYKQLYLEELKVRKSLATKLNKTNERLAEISTKLFVEKQQNKSLLSSLTVRPVLDPHYPGDLNNSLVFNKHLSPRENLVISLSTSNQRPSSNSMETFLTKMQQELEKNITRELEEAAAEFESVSYRASPLGSTDESNLNQDLLLKTSQEYVQILKKNYMI
ncbi:PREDICTED: ankyrin repeat domain-containing protein 26 isoform X2 [Condylura cristata]|uniref:ankyrin repeat domain-containing protein 26 isoform X2 n=1 Tax=Condylura cristata TaxID=143302 RepID=UPI0006435144|nr:PREDICTED: ankyrin repeat domain-containing protein 26 isoform X2 [Condylura cristata]